MNPLKQRVHSLWTQFIADTDTAFALAFEQIKQEQKDLEKKLLEGHKRLEDERKQFEAYKSAQMGLLNTEREQLDTVAAMLEQEKEFVSHQQLVSGKKIKLDVGGKIFCTSIVTLTSQPNSMLSAMFSGRFSLAKDEDGCFFLDRDAKHFEKILAWLRSQEVPTFTDEREKESFLREVCYFQLDALKAVLEDSEEEDDDSDLFTFEFDAEKKGKVVTVVSPVTATYPSWDNGVFGNKAIPKDRVCYWEVEVTVGANTYVGIGRKGAVNLDINLGDGKGICFNHRYGHKWLEGTAYIYGKRTPRASIIGVLVDLSKHSIAFYLNGEYLGVAFDKLPDDEYFPLFGDQSGVHTLRTGLKPPVTSPLTK
jgi:hypothetical protein